jgi:hypothetical protein
MPRKPGEEYVLDLYTGRIMGVTDYMKNDIEGAIRLKGRFIPWNGEIPVGGKIDLADWQKDKAKEIQSFQQDIVTQLPNAPEKPAQAPQDKPLISAEIQTKPVTESDRLSVIMSVIPKLTEANMTKAEPKIPTVASLNQLTGLNDISGPERENAFAQFMQAYPNWKPAPVTE